MLLGYYDCGNLVFAGKAGTGFDLNTGRDLNARLRKLERADPRLVAEVAFSTWTADYLLRHPSFQGLREDKPAREVQLERSRKRRS